MKKNAVVIGYSGHAYVVIDTLLSKNYTVTAYCEQNMKRNNPYELKYLGSEKDLDVLKRLRDFSIFLGIGDNVIRRSIFEGILDQKLDCPFITHKNAYVSPFCEIDLGTVVMPGVILNSKSEIGKAVICNSSSIIEHECKIGNYSHIGPGAVLNGNVTVGEGTFIGANAVIKQGINIGINAFIGAGSVVTKDIPDGALVYGNPARIK